MMASGSESWSSVLKRARCARFDGDDNFFYEFQGPIAHWEVQISSYIDYLSSPRKPGQQLNDDEKYLIVETRAAIRFGLCCLSCDDEGERRDLQIRLVKNHQWHFPLATLLSQESGDSKCRVFAAKLFSNIVTSNDVTATAVSRAVRLSPSADDISTTIQKKISPPPPRSADDTQEEESGLQEANWVSMLVAASRRNDREALAGVTAALYNCIVALPTTRTRSTKRTGDDDDDQQLSFDKNLASDTMLISTFLRQFISVNFIKASVMAATTTTTEDDSPAGEDWDAATDWIFLLVVRLFGFGMLPTMYKAISGDSESSPPSAKASVLPEHNVLLHCAAQEAQSFIENETKIPGEGKNPFGGEMGWTTLKTNYEFLANLFCLHYQGSNDADNDGDGDGDDDDETDSQLARSAALSSLDIISITLGLDNPECTKLREHLGSHTELLATSSKCLGSLVDELTERSEGLKARDLKLSSEEQQWIVTLVRLIGNMCYNSRSNQDRIRMTLVPPSKALSTTNTATNNSDVARNALHVLMSCTSFATSCFTLREWGVIAIRNLLQDNEENQKVVAALDAQDPIQTAALDQAGVRVKMDKNGQVSLTTLDENNES